MRMSTQKNNQNQFLASASHELRTPLVSILGYGELLKGTKLDGRQSEYLSRMLNSSTYLLTLVGDLIDIIKIENEDIKLDIKEVRLHSILRNCTELIKVNLSKEVDFEIDIPFLDYTIMADERRIKQILLNFLSNAAKFTQKGKIKFYVKKIEEMDEHVKITVNIEDTGIGMSQETQKKLFQPFITGDSTQGFGLGLFISKEIIELMDGDISVTSQEGVGSEFSISLVVKKAYDKKLSNVLSGKKILIISNEVEYTDKLSVLLRNFNALPQCISASENISDTLKDIFSKEIEYDIAVFDMNMQKYFINEISSALKIIKLSTKYVALLDKNTLPSTSTFDRLIETPTTARNLLFGLEELCAIDHKKSSDTVDFSHLKVLVVEDVEMSRDYLEEMFFVSFSIRCDTAVNGKEAVEKTKNVSYDIIFMDIRMPIMNGHEATQKIRKFNEHVPIVCMSADVYEKDITAAKKSGMNSFIEKPIDKNNIKQCLWELIDGEKKELALEELTTKGTIDKNIINSSIKNDPVELKIEACKHLKKNLDTDVVHSLLAKAAQSIEKYVKSAKFNIIEKNVKALFEDIHALKGVLANLGLKNQATIAGKLQEMCHTDEFPDGIDEKYKFLEIMTLFVNELKRDNNQMAVVLS